MMLLLLIVNSIVSFIIVQIQMANDPKFEAPIVYGISYVVVFFLAEMVLAIIVGSCRHGESTRKKTPEELAESEANRLEYQAVFEKNKVHADMMRAQAANIRATLSTKK